MKVWQIAAGSDQRDYSKDFLDYGIAFLGGEKQSNTFREVSTGDLLVLKRGIHSIRAIGVVREVFVNLPEDHLSYQHWLRDYDGWVLDSYATVDWRTGPEDEPFSGLSMGTMRRIRGDEACEQIREFHQSWSQVVSNPNFPVRTKAITYDEIAKFLVEKGSNGIHAGNAISTLVRLRSLAEYYRDTVRRKNIREHEARTFLVIPLLIALGWDERNIKIELSTTKANTRLGKIDIALFRNPYRREKSGRSNAEDCEVIVETKGLSIGLDLAGPQAVGYASLFPNLKRVITTNGYCYKAYEREGDGFSESVSSYLNILEPRDAYPRDPRPGTGALEALKAMMPSGG